MVIWTYNIKLTYTVYNVYKEVQIYYIYITCRIEIAQSTFSAWDPFYVTVHYVRPFARESWNAIFGQVFYMELKRAS